MISDQKTTVQQIVAALVSHGCDPHQDGDGYRSRCCCHDGDSPNVLAISSDGKCHCHKCGANTGDVLRELGLANSNAHAGQKPKVQIDGKQVTLHATEQSAIDGLTWSVFQKQGGQQREPDRVHRYHDADGSHVGTVLLWKFPTGEKQTRQIRKHVDGWICKGMSSPRPLYRLPQILAADHVVIAEGEKTVDALWVIGIEGTTPTQGSRSPAKTDWKPLTGKHVTISVDNDQAGREFGKRVIDLISDIVASVRVVELTDDWPQLPEKGDAADWVEQFADVNTVELRRRFDALPDHFETIAAIKTERPKHDTALGADASLGIETILDEKAVNDQVLAALAARGDLYDHNGSLSVISSESIADEPARKVIRHLGLASLREMISETCVFYCWAKDPEGNSFKKLSRPARWCYEAILVRGQWLDIPPIRGIVTSPVLRADGSILQTQGYDIDSGLYVDLTEVFPFVSEEPTADDVQRAVDSLFDLTSDFPFNNAASRAAWLASLLTPLAREAYRGCTGPLFLFDANVRGSGKSLLADINSLIVTGREATRLTSPQNDEEARKRITALVNDSDRVVLIDNIAGRFGSPSLDAALTGTIWKDRRLGHTELIEAPLRMTWYASGNNVLLAADTARRVCHIRLESPLENPEDRSGFKHADIRKHVRQNRPALLAAALTILRGYVVAGRPNQGLKSWGSFEGWSDLVRNSIVWCGQADPGETRTELRSTSDSEAGALRQMLVAVQLVDQDNHGLRTSDMLKIAIGKTAGDNKSYSLADSDLLCEGIEMFCEASIDRVNTRRLGVRLSHFRNRVVDQMAFDCTLKSGTNYWFVQPAGGCGVSSVSHSANLYTSKFVSVRDNQKHIAATGENTYTRSTTSTDMDIEWLDELT